MTTDKPKPAIAWVPACIGTLLWTGATMLLLQDAYRTGLTANHLLMPILTIGTIAAAVECHRALSSWRLLSAVGFLALALLGSSAVTYATMGRQAEGRDVKISEALRANRALDVKQSELKEAKDGAKAECKTIGPRCTQWQARVDALTKEASGMATVALDPRVDAVANIASLVGFDASRVRAIVEAIDPLQLPLFLELGSVLFWAQAFPTRCNRQPIVTVTAQPIETITQSWTQAEALEDLQRMKAIGAQHLLAERWGVSRGTASRWLRDWADAGLIDRQRNGREKATLALPPPRT